MPSKKSLNEQQIRSQFITPAIVKAGWDLATQVGENCYITKGRVVVRGQVASRAKGKALSSEACEMNTSLSLVPIMLPASNLRPALRS